MSVKIFALAAFLFFAPAVSQAANIVHITGTVAKVKWQVRREVGIPDAFTLTTTNKTIISDPAAAAANTAIDMDITNALQEGISGTINMAGVGKNHSGGLYLQFSGNLLPPTNGGKKEFSQGQVVLGYLLMNDDETYNPAWVDIGFGGATTDEVVVFSGTVTATIVSRQDSSGNSIGTVSFNIYPNSAEIWTIDPNQGYLTGPPVPAILTITMSPIRFTSAP